VPARYEIFVFEEDRQLALGACGAVAAVHEIAADRLREIPANRAGRRGERVGRADKLAAPVDCILAFDRQRNQRSARNEGDEVVEERFAAMLAVVLARAIAVELHQVQSSDHVTAALHPADDLTHEAARDRVGLAKNQCAFDTHSPGGYGERIINHSLVTAGPYADAERALAGTPFASIEYRQQTESTNADAAALLGDPRHGGLTIVAGYQRHGRGRKGRSWEAAPDTALLFTTILPHDVAAERLWLVPFWTAIAVRRALNAWRMAPQLQWPNDVLLERRKLAGILCVSQVTGQRARVACGVGVNLRRTPAAVSDAACCDDVAAVDGAALLVAILRAFDETLPLLDRPPDLVAQWEAAADIPGARYRIAPDNVATPFDATALGLEDGGALRVRRDDGTIERVEMADVRVLR
jgi:BirA family biotin operon repressor/biotin-[acetyl-CoA-carboxylase] ligase